MFPLGEYILIRFINSIGQGAKGNIREHIFKLFGIGVLTIAEHINFKMEIFVFINSVLYYFHYLVYHLFIINYQQESIAFTKNFDISGLQLVISDCFDFRINIFSDTKQTGG